jgi:hypothetical protein
MTLVEMIRSIDEGAGNIVQGYYLDGEEGQPNPSKAYCDAHARRAAALFTSKRGKETMAYLAWGGSDRLERCAIVTCDLALDTGGLTDYGVSDALGVGERGYLPTFQELSAAASSMVADDPRWTRWRRLARRRLLQEKRPPAKERP